MKKLFLKISQNLQKNTCGLRNFQETLWQNTSPNATLLKSGTANSVRKNLDEYSLSKKYQPSKYRSGISFPSQQHKLLVYVFIGLHYLLPQAATRVQMFCKKSVFKNFVNFRGKHLCWRLFNNC